MSTREAFPFFSHNPQCVYLDSAATSQRLSVALSTAQYFDEKINANIHRGISRLAGKATDAFEHARSEVAAWCGVSAENSIATYGATYGMNLLAAGLPLSSGERVVITAADHHSTFLPWMSACKKASASFTVVAPESTGVISTQQIIDTIDTKTTYVVLPHISNVTGQLFDISAISKAAHAVGARVIVDAAQAARAPVPALTLGADAAVYSSHKCYGSSGSGAIAVGEALVKKLSPAMLGGGQVARVTDTEYTLLDAPQKFEAGTPALSAFVGFGAACAWLQEQNMKKIATHDAACVHSLRAALSTIDELTLLGNADSYGCVTVATKGFAPDDLAQLLDEQHIVVRVGHHCTQPLHSALGLAGSLRFSVGCYTTEADIEQAVEATKASVKLLMRA